MTRSSNLQRRVLVDALGAPKGSGGMQLYAFELINAWLGEYPDDDLVLLVPNWLFLKISQSQNWRNVHSAIMVVWSNDGALMRAIGQLIVRPFFAFKYRVRGVLSLNAIASPFFPSSRQVIVAHDWRHLKNPEEFGIAQKLYRRLWSYSVKRASKVICVSSKTQVETDEITHRLNSVCVEHGRDHPRAWSISPRMALAQRGSRKHKDILTFGHHTNKRPGLVIEAWKLLVKESEDTLGLRLTVLGVGPENAKSLIELHGLEGMEGVSFPGYVDDLSYQKLVATADVVVLASTDEGFGIPVSEATFFEVPTVITEDSGIVQLHGEQTLVSQPSAGAISRAIELALQLDSGSRKKMSGNTWLETATQTRAEVRGCL